jgi:GT2 family glycosyltransferase
MFSVSVVIPTFNGRDLLLANLPPLLEALEEARTAWEILVVDDASSDDTVPMLRRLFPEVVVLENPVNMGFGETVNRGFFAARNDIVLALNNDVTVERDLFTKTLPRFRDESVFAVTPSVLDPVTRRQQAIHKLRPGICWYRDTSLPEPPPDDEIPLFFASGGSSLYHRRKIVALGGFSTLYAPFYVEDVDLSYQAWKRGWKSVMAPEATVWHPVNSTIRRYHRRRKIKYLIGRNKHLFLWANVTDTWLVLRYFLCLAPSLVWDLLSFRKYKLVGMFLALARISEAMRERRARRPHAARSDREIIRCVRSAD